MNFKDTIAAIATPPGEGSISVIRISGPVALSVVSKIFTTDLCLVASHTVQFGTILDKEKQAIDQVLLLVMRGPKSFTGEDVVEINCHGGVLITQEVLRRVLEVGIRMAQPGEFSYRAFLNGKIDLIQAEAIQQLIGAKSQKALHLAYRQLEGKLSKKVSSFQEKLTRIFAIIEAWVDFPEEGLVFSSSDEMIQSLEILIAEIKHLLASYDEGSQLMRGISVCIVGATNVGKSSLMNSLLDKNRAIVTPIEGTTRDSLEDQVIWGGMGVNIIDTAGIRDNPELIEKKGIERTFQAIKTADIILMVLDQSNIPRTEEFELFNILPKQKTFLIFNKNDLPLQKQVYSEFLKQKMIYFVSAKHQEGIEVLKSGIKQFINHGSHFSKEDVLLTNARHKESLKICLESTSIVLKGFKEGVSPEFLTFDLRQALQALGKIIGIDITENLLDAIFSQFCLGK